MKQLSRQGYPLAAAICLALGLSSAQAAINPGTQATASSGEMFLSVYDVDNATTYAIDLATTVNQFVDGIVYSSYSWTLGPHWADFIGSATGELKWNVGAFNMYTNVQLLDPHYGSLISQTNITNLNEADPRFVQISQLQGGHTGLRNQAIYLNNALPASTPIVTPGKSKLTDYAANWDLTTTVANAFHDGAGLGMWQANGYLNADGTEHTTIDGENNETVKMVWWHTGSAPGTTTNDWASFDVQSGVMALDLTSGTLNWTAVSEVPLPGAAWMFLGGLLSLLRFTHRGRQSVQA